MAVDLHIGPCRPQNDEQLTYSFSGFTWDTVEQ
jgi:hypothetical protein